MALFNRTSYRYIVVLIVVMAAACSTVDDSMAVQSFKTDKPCAAPCWYGLEPGSSTKADVVAVLKQLDFVDSASIQEYSTTCLGDDHAQGISFGCVHPQTASCGGAVIFGDKLKLLTLSASSKLTVKMTVDKLGIPDYVEYGLGAQEVGGCKTVLSWPQRGIEVVVFDATNETVCRALMGGQGIPPDLRVTDLDYLAQDAFASGPAGCCPRIPWPGFAKP